ncbi:MAG: hypothetical protein JST73_13265 [Actinobacteria bacterium]|nr:hypothetical protein [Actinomycetota bacterium]
MPQQFVILTILLVCAVLLAVGFVVTARLARKGPDDYEPIHDTGYRIRRYWFVFLMVVAAGGLGYSIPHMPYPMTRKPSASAPVTTVKVTAHQFSWDVQPVDIVAHRHIRFEVTSADVNHDFMIEDPQGNIVAQVQAMPTVTNSLYVTFDKPGQYLIRCGELCGLYHTSMIMPLVVKA